MTRTEMLKRFRHAIQGLEFVVPVSSEIFVKLCDELDLELGNKDYPLIDTIDIEYLTGA